MQRSSKDDTEICRLVSAGFESRPSAGGEDKVDEGDDDQFDE